MTYCDTCKKEYKNIDIHYRKNKNHKENEEYICRKCDRSIIILKKMKKMDCVD